MRNRWLWLFTPLLLSSTILDAQTLPNQVRLVGQQIEYANYHLELKTQTHSFLKEEKVIGSMYVDSAGNFDFTLPLEKATYTYTDLGKVRAYVYLEPGTTYRIQLPPFQQRGEQERLNPFFFPETTTLGILNKEARNLNRQILEFTEYFDYLFNKEALALSRNSDDKRAYEIRTFLDEKFLDTDPLFLQHKELTYIKLWVISNPRKLREIISHHFLHKEINYELPAYTDAFMLLFKNFVPSGFEKSVRDSLEIKLKTRASFLDLSNTIVKDSLFSQHRELGELILLYGIYQGFYNQSMDEATVIRIAENAATTGSTTQVKEIATALHQKLTKLRPGSPAPNFTLYNQDGQKRTLENYKGKFIYLNFVHTKNYACQRDLETMIQLQSTFKKNLEIVTVVMNEKREEMDSYLKQNKQKWDFLHILSYPQILDQYNIMAVPAYYLISPDGKLLLSPAPTPEENFRVALMKEIQSYEQKKLQDTPEERRSIFR
ncbi:MAG TPA: redoxin domain-containing protein [Marinilabiliaceae bacterium]|nr:redoxin domain-containing protein [Marinilabiliaceae bacterium]